MHKKDIHKVGLVFGALWALIHVAWSALVALGWAQSSLDFMFKLHMVKSVFTVSDFSLFNAGILVVITAVIGYVVGSVLAFLWNKLTVR